MTRLTITTDWEALSEGEPEERSTFALLAIAWGDVWLTEGRDRFVNVLRRGPLVSAYPLAEWLTWNWWRLRWEPRTSAADWDMAHRLTAIGEGYLWPDLTIHSDGERTALVTRPTAESLNAPFRYINDFAVIAPSREFESCVDDFVERVRGKLRAGGISETNLDRLWADLAQERSDEVLSKKRRFEALLGHDPDEADPAILERLAEDAQRLGQSAMQDIAAGRLGDRLPTADVIAEIAAQNGSELSPRDAFRLSGPAVLPRPREVAAWRLAVEAARAVRAQAHLGDGPISDSRLSQLAGLSAGALVREPADTRFAYALDEGPSSGRMVFRSRWRTGRRFELARIIGDRVMRRSEGTLLPATSADTYWQKAQRAFAAELLSPYEAVDAAMDADYSEDRQEEVAEYFDVSPLTINTLLKNHARISRDGFDPEYEEAAA